MTHKPPPGPRGPSTRAPTPPTPGDGEHSEDAQFARLQDLLDLWPDALDASALDGYVCGVLLQPQTIPAAVWLPYVTDPEGQGLPAQRPPRALQALHDLVLHRYETLRHAIDARQWFDPWLAVPEGEAEPEADAANGEDADAVADDDGDGDGDADAYSVTECVLPWVAGFALATDLFPALTDRKDPALNEPLALLYLHLDPDDLEDADALLAHIEQIEPPADLSEAAQDLVRAVLLLADVSQSLRKPTRGGGRR